MLWGPFSSRELDSEGLRGSLRARFASFRSSPIALQYLDLVLNSGPGARESWRRDLRAPGPLFNTTPIVPIVYSKRCYTVTR